MTRQEFLREDWGGVPLNEEYTIWARDNEILHRNDDSKDHICATQDEMFNVKIGDKTVEEIIESWSEMPTMFLDADPVWHYKDSNN